MSDIRKRTGSKGTTYQVRYPSEAAKSGYAYETFGKHDWRTDTLNPFTPGAITPSDNAIYLGNDIKSYSAHIVGLTLAYQFK